MRTLHLPPLAALCLAALCLAALGLAALADSARAAGPSYAPLNEVLVRNVREGYVDYDGIKADPAFARFIKSIGNTEPGDLASADERTALLINAYNCFAILGILDGRSPASWFGRGRYFKDPDYRLLGEEVSLRTLEQDKLGAPADPRLYFALACGALNCPRLANQAFEPSNLPARLEAAARSFVNDGTRNRFDPDRRIAYLSPLFDRHGDDFVRSAGSVQKYLAAYADNPAVAALLRQDGFEIWYLDDDWALNGIYRGAGD